LTGKYDLRGFWVNDLGVNKVWLKLRKIVWLKLEEKVWLKLRETV
jgi:hypothetical protein